MIITVICLSGASLLFEKEITQLLNPHIYKVEKPDNAQALPLEIIIDNVNNTFSDSLSISSLQISNDPCIPLMFSFDGVARKNLSVNQYNSDINGWSKSYPFFSTMRKLHRWLLNPPEAKGEMSIGKLIVGISTIVFIIIIITGLIIWVPKSMKSLKNRLSVSSNKGFKRFIYDAHVSLGFYVSILLLVMALTGLTWSFKWYRNAAYSLFGVKTQKVEVAKNSPSKNNIKEGDKEETLAQTSIFNNIATLNSLIMNVNQMYPEAKAITISNKNVFVTKNGSNMRRGDTIEFSHKDGSITSVVPYSQQPRQQKVRTLFFSLHTGNWGGMIVKILYFIATIIGASLPITGYYLWISKKRRKAYRQRGGN